MTQTPIRYLEDEFPDFEILEQPVPVRGPLGLLPGQSADGYGSRITTHRVVKMPYRKPYRVYATCHSNVASHWITKNNQRYYLR